MRLKIKHVSQYDFDEPADYALQKVRLRPASSNLQDVHAWTVKVDGGKVETSYQDHYGNHVDLTSSDIGARKMVLTAEGEATTHDASGVLGKSYGRAPLWHFQQPTEFTTPGEHIKSLAKTVLNANAPLDGLHAMSEAILQTVPYMPDQTNASTTAEQAIEIGQGVCQDHANIFVAAARVAGLPARYVSGYLFMPDRVDQDASHGWAEAHLDDLGWVGFDVSNGVSPDEKYLRIAIGRDANEATPISGLRMGTGDEALIVSLQVQQ